MRTLLTVLGLFRCCLAAALSLLLVAQPAFAGVAYSDKELPNAPVPLAADPSTLTITILDGEGALNNIRSRNAREPIIQVTDENHKPVAGAFVLFKIVPGPNGAGGSFGGASSLNVQTDAAGRAVGHGLQPNSIGGRYQIQVTARTANATGQTTIHQSNQKGVVSPTHRLVKLSIVAAAIAVGILIGIQSHSYSNSTRITVGAGGVGGP